MIDTQAKRTVVAYFLLDYVIVDFFLLSQSINTFCHFIIKYALSVIFMPNYHLNSNQP